MRPEIFNLNYTTYAVICLRAALPAAARYVPLYLYVVFALCEGKTTYEKKEKYRCERAHTRHYATRANMTMRQQHKTWFFATLQDLQDEQAK
jgi:hypothetical protein